MPRRNRDELDELLHEAKVLRHLERQKEAQARAKAPAPIQPQRPTRQLESPGWYEARTILIVQENPDHSLTPLGVYIEHLHPVYGRHLVPCPSLDTSPNQEVVTSWGAPRPRPELPRETPEEIQAIRNRFHSLLAELSQEDS